LEQNFLKAAFFIYSNLEYVADEFLFCGLYKNRLFAEGKINEFV
jgi:hypothetical protein